MFHLQQSGFQKEIFIWFCFSRHKPACHCLIPSLHSLTQVSLQRWDLWQYLRSVCCELKASCWMEAAQLPIACLPFLHTQLASSATGDGVSSLKTATHCLRNRISIWKICTETKQRVHSVSIHSISLILLLNTQMYKAGALPNKICVIKSELLVSLRHSFNT